MSSPNSVGQGACNSLFFLTNKKNFFALYDYHVFIWIRVFHGSGTSNYSWSKNSISDFVELLNSGGVKALDLRIVNDGETPSDGDKCHEGDVKSAAANNLL